MCKCKINNFSFNRSSGILLPIFSLPSKYGIGSFSKEAYEFVDLLIQTNQKYWQILPMGPTCFGDSPYQSYSSFAGNPFFIDIEDLIKDGLLSNYEEELNILDQDINRIDYTKQRKYKINLLKKAYKKFTPNTEYEHFCIENKFWLDEYCLFIVLKNKYKCEFFNFPKQYKKLGSSEIKKYILEYKSEINEQKFIQYIFYKQWFKLKEYANKNGIEIIGDLPIYLCMDSSDVWIHKDDIMQFDGDEPSVVSGCPPDIFSKEGQLWGNPIYNWNKMKNNEYEWWCKRFEFSFKLFDVLRLDHFRGFDSYYCIDSKAKDAQNGIWENGPGIEFFKIIDSYLKKKNINLKIIAEDLGDLNDSSRKLLVDTGFAGMKIIQFAYSSIDSVYLNYNHIQNCVVYTGTHDNNTIIGWLKNMNSNEMQYLREYLGIFNRDIDNWDIIRLAMSSVGNLAIIPFFDYLGMDEKGRINIPGTVGNNWNIRYRKDQLNEGIIDGIRYYTNIYGRNRGY